MNESYYKKVNNTQGYTEIRGEHVVVGATPDYEGMDPAMKARVDKYIADHNLDGTITEIASDVVVVNTLIAKYIEADDITANTSLWTDYFHANRASIAVHLYCPEIVADDIWWRGNQDHDPSPSNSLKHNTIMVFANNNDVNKTLTSSISGDDVTISFTTMDSVTRSTTFTKPASLGSVTWSRGGNGGTLTAKTVGGADFLVGTVGPYSPSGSQEAQQAEQNILSYGTIFGMTYVAKDRQNVSSTKKTMLFKTPKNRYPEAVSTIRAYSSSSGGKTDGGKINLDFGGRATVHARYQTEAQFDVGPNGAGGYTDTPGIEVIAPSKPNAQGATEAKKGNVTYHDRDTIALGYSDSVKVYGKYKLDDSNTYIECAGITITSPENNETEHSIDIPNSSISVVTNPSGQGLSILRNAINTAKSNDANEGQGKYVVFTVKCGSNASKKYYMDFR